jgi:O-antigen/teichoic acid export membrane protein
LITINFKAIGMIRNNQFVGSVIVKSTSLLLGVVITAILARTLNLDDFGSYTLVISIATMISIPAQFGLPLLVVRETARAYSNNDAAAIFRIWIWVGRVGLATSIFVAMVASVIVHVFVDDPSLRPIYFCGAFLVFLLPWPPIIAGAIRGLGYIFWGQLIEVFLRPAILLILLVTSISIWPQIASSPTGATSLTLASYAIALFIGVYILAKLAPPAVEVPRSTLGRNKELMVASISFGAISAAQLINNNLDLVMIGSLRTSAETGIYKAAVTISSLISFGLAIVNPVIMPKIAALYSTHEMEELKNLITRSAWLITFIAIAGLSAILLFGEEILTVIYGSNFRIGHTALIVLIFGQLANALFGPVALVLNMVGHERTTLAGVSISVVLNAVLNYFLIPEYGIIGAAISTSISLFFWNFTLAILLWRKAGINPTAFRLFRK